MKILVDLFWGRGEEAWNGQADPKIHTEKKDIENNQINLEIEEQRWKTSILFQNLMQS